MIQTENTPPEEAAEAPEEPQEPDDPVEESVPEPEPQPEEAPMIEDLEGELAEARDAPEAEEAPEEEPVEPQERFDVAQAPPPPVPESFVQEVRTGRTRDDGGTENSGPTSFEAREHALGEYMLQVRRKVEQQWRVAVRLKYASVRHAEARVKMSIRPDGTLASVEIIEEGTSLSFAVLSREAVREAGPFDPLPFDVPEVYRSKNLDITWRFTYN